MTSPKPQPPRPADIAIVGQRMLTGLLHRVWQHNYKQLAPKPRSLLLMNIMFRIAIATHEGKPLNLTSLAKVVNMPVNTVRPHLALLVKHHRIKMIAGRKRGKGEESVLIANLDHLDRMMTLQHVNASIETIENCLDQMLDLREALHERLVCNGKKQAAE